MQTLAHPGPDFESDLQLPPRAARLVVVFWWFFALATVILIPGGDQPERLRRLSLGTRLLIAPLAPLFAWVFLHTCRDRVRNAVRRLGLPGCLRFSLVGALCGLVLAVRLATHGEPDGGVIAGFTAAADASSMTGSPTPGGLPGLNGLPWDLAVLAHFAVYWAVLGLWLVLRGQWAFSCHHVFWLGGLAFALVAEKLAVLRALAHGDGLGASLLLAYLIPVHGLPFAATFMLTPPEDLPRARQRPGLAACVACAVLPLMLYKSWGFAWFCLVG